MKVLYYAPFASTSGYGRASADYAACMVKAGIDLKIQALEDGADTDNLEDRYQWLVPYATREDDFQPDVVLVHTIPQYCHEFVTGDLDPAAKWGEGVKKVALTTWETNKLPEEAARRLYENFDLVLVPSQWNLDVFKASGIKVDLSFHSFDPPFWYDPPYWSKSVKPYRFYCVSEWNERKNLVGLLKAYYAEFKPTDNVRLTIVCKGFHEGSVKDLELATAFEQVPQVEWRGLHPNRLTQEELMRLHREDGHCFVTLSRGEGWGLGAFEAALMGNHVIYSDFSGHQTFMPYTNKRSAIRCMQTPVVDAKLDKDVTCAGLQIPKTADVPGFGFAADQTWAEPDLQQAMEAMRAAYEGGHGLDGGSIQDDSLRERFIKKFSYDAVGAKLLKTLEAL